MLVKACDRMLLVIMGYELHLHVFSVDNLVVLASEVLREVFQRS